MYSLQNHLISNPSYIHLGKHLLRLSWRYIHHSKTTHLQYVPHAYSFDEAIQRIVEHDKDRFFARKTETSSALANTPNANHPLSKMLIPTFVVNATVSMTRYSGMYGYYHTETYTDADGDTHSRTTTVWCPTFGTLANIDYSLENGSHMTVYGGSQFHDETVETAFSRQLYKNSLIDFDQKEISKDVLIDPFDKKDAYVQSIAQNRVYQAELSRAEKDIMRQHCTTLASICTLNYDNIITINKNLLPAYLLQYPNSPVRVLPALARHNRFVHGIAATSDLKVMSAVTSTALMLTYLFPPQISLPARTFGIIFTALFSGIYSHYRLDIHHGLQSERIRRLRAQNDEVSATFADSARLEATSRDMRYFNQEISALDIDETHYERLNISPDEPISEEKVLVAYHEQLQKVHPDKGGNVNDTIAVLNAKAAFMTAIQKQKHHGINLPQRRHFSTQVKVPPRSVYYPRTNELIDAVFDKRYKDALTLIENGDAHPDGHDKRENTLLTEAVKRHNYQAASFALKELQCSPDASCDCPLHNTALHYAVQSADNDSDAKSAIQLVQLLLDHGARVNLINSTGETPLDITKNSSIRQLILNNGGIAHRASDNPKTSMPLFRRIFGYRSNERILIESAIQNKSDPLAFRKRSR